MQNNTIHIVGFKVKQWNTENVPTQEEVAAGWFFGKNDDYLTDTIVF